MNHHDQPTNPVRSRLAPRALAGVCAAWLVICVGCYDTGALVDKVRIDSQQDSFHEIDLGVYRTTMPRESINDDMLAMTLHLFGTLPQHRIPAVEQQLEMEGYRLRYEMLTAIRRTKREELAEPDLGELRARLTKVVNEVLTEASVETIGVEDFQIVYQ